jgi:hypothetical protein
MEETTIGKHPRRGGTLPCCDEFDRGLRDHMKVREIEDSMLNIDEN